MKGNRMAIRYKVVNEERESCYVQGKYKLKYNQGDIVKADIKTHGIMTFKDYNSAKKFYSENQCRFYGSILQVKPFGKAKRVRKVSYRISDALLDIYYGNKRMNTVTPPNGTLCYHAVEVLT